MSTGNIIFICAVGLIIAVIIKCIRIYKQGNKFVKEEVKE
jgi:hypothetical protein